MRTGIPLLLLALFPAMAQQGPWRSLFDGKTFSGWHDPALRTPPGDGWSINDGALMSNPKPRFREDLATRDKFGDFELEFEWRIAPGANSGLKYLVQDAKFIDLDKAAPASIQKQVAAEFATGLSKRAQAARGKDYTIGFEFQLIDDAKSAEAKSSAVYATGALYSLIAPSASPGKPAGEWNTARILVRNNRVEHWINGAKVLEAALTNEQISGGLNKRWGVEHPVYRLLTGRPAKRTSIVLTHHGDQAWFRNLRIREMGPGR